MAATGQTLKSLTVYGIDDRDDTTSLIGVTDLTGFERLKNLTIGASLLSSSPLHRFPKAEPNDVPLWDIVIPSLRWDTAIPHLADLLSPSIARLQLLTGTQKRSMNCLQSLFTDYFAEKAAKLPALADVEICRFRGQSEREEKISISWPEAVILARNVNQC